MKEVYASRVNVVVEGKRMNLSRYIVFAMPMFLCGCNRTAQLAVTAESKSTHFGNDVRDAKTPPEKATTRISAIQAIDKVRQTIKDVKWQIAFVSNSGVSQSVKTGNDDDLMHTDGKAAHWVIELFQNKPKPYAEGGKTGKLYPFRIMSVTSEEVTELPDNGGLVVPKKLSLLQSQYINNLDAARQLAVKQVKAHFDVMSASSEVHSDGSCKWRFRFYDVNNQKTVNKICISGNGTKVLPW